MRILFLHGYMNSSSLAEAYMIGGLQRAFPGAKIDVPDGCCSLTKREHVIAQLGTSGNIGSAASRIADGYDLGLASWAYTECALAYTTRDLKSAHKSTTNPSRGSQQLVQLAPL